MIGFPATSVAAIALAAFAAGGSVTYYVMNNAQKAKELKIYKEGERRVALQQGIVDGYIEEVADLRKRKPRVVYYSSPMSPDSSGSGEACAPEVNRRDLGPLLRETADELIRCNAAREAGKVK